MKGRACEAFAIDVAQAAHRAAITQAQQIPVIRIASKRREHGNGIQARTVVVQLAFTGSAGRGSIEEIPETPRVAVVSPVWNGWHESKNGIERDLRLVVGPEVFCHAVDLFLPGGVPRHFAAEGKGAA